MSVHLVKTIITNLSSQRRVVYLPPNGKVMDAFATISIPGFLDVYLYLGKHEDLLALYYAEQASGLIDVVYEIDGVSGGTGVLATANADMAALVTTVDGDLASAVPVSQTPLAPTYVAVFVNGAGARVADGPAQQTIRDCYFSADGGATARAFGAVSVGDRLYWNGSVAGYELGSTDRLSFLYTSN